MRILILTLGTRGDVEPMLALGKSLQARGHAVTLCAPDNCARWVREEHALPFAPLGLDFKALMQSREVREARGGVEAAIGRGVLAAMPKVLRAASDAAQAGVDLVVSSVTFPGGPDIAEAHGAALVSAALAPVFATRRFPFFLASGGPCGVLNRASYVLPSLARAMHGKELARWRRESLRLSASAPTVLEMGRRTDGSVAPRMCCVSPSVVPQPDDWDASTTMTGYWRLDDPTQWAPDAALSAFLAGGGGAGADAGAGAGAGTPAAPVVYIGFGSMTILEPAALAAIVLPAVRAAGVRAILQLGWSGAADAAGAASGAGAASDVFYLDAAPHAKLFALVAAVVHHGGAGTTAAGLAAGRPTLICPIGADQPFWGSRVHRELGCGPAPVPLLRLTPALLAARLRALVGDEGYRRNAAELASRIAREDGLARAAEVVEAEGRRCGKMGI
jgi:sterol 3beta-glucosyltransferase